MIVSRRDNGRLLVFRQYDHAGVTGEVTAHWGNDRFQRPDPYESCVIAAGNHDIGWIEPDEEPLMDENKKRPMHFLDLDARRHAEFYKVGVERVLEKDLYAGLLVGMHWTGLYTGRWGWDSVNTGRLSGYGEEERPFLEAIIAEHEKRELELKRQLWDPMQTSRSEFERRLWDNFDLLQVWDLLVLFICLNDLSKPATQVIKNVPVAPYEPNVDLEVRSLGDGRVSLDPYPLSVPELQVSVRARWIDDRDYRDRADARAALDNADEEQVIATYVPAQGASAQAQAV